ncbi:MAG: response regulator transcription factor [Lachnospiraceae bacterium]|nr:response regulator transcription factor [Lachnospiraceae bacterium]
MENELINVLIADDEPLVRDGLKYIIDWNALGFCICGEAANGDDALAMIHKYQPGLVLLDIRMPGMYGTELMEKVRGEGFSGDFIILSGYSDFKYAQTALHFGASFYLTKPIDEDELEKAVISVREKIETTKNRENSLNQYLSKAKTTVLYDLIATTEFNPSINYVELGLSFPIYQIIIYEGYTPYYRSYSFADILRVTNHDNNSFEHITVDGHDVILLKGNFALERFQACLRHYEEGTQKGSPLDTIFLAYGPTVSSLSNIHTSYEMCLNLMNRRFFCEENQHVLSYENLPAQSENALVLDEELALSYATLLVNYLKTCNHRRISEVLTNLKNDLYNCNAETSNIKYFLADIFLQIKTSIMHTYSDADIPFAHNAAIIELIENKYYLYEILLYFTEQFDMIMRAIGSNSNESILDDIIDYIRHNYAMPLKLETIAPLFGYNSSYLGKLFTQKMGLSFNSYLDQVRIREAVNLLDNTDMKVYEIAAKVGYKNVDYFHQKFKKRMNMSPAEYRKR